MEIKAILDTILLYVFYPIAIITIVKKALYLKTQNKTTYYYFLSFSIITFCFLVLSVFAAWGLMFYYILLAPISIIIFLIIIYLSYSFPFYDLNLEISKYDINNIFLHIGEYQFNENYIFSFFLLFFFYCSGILQWVLLLKLYIKKKSLFLKILFYFYLLFCFLVVFLLLYNYYYPSLVIKKNDCFDWWCPAI